MKTLLNIIIAVQVLLGVWWSVPLLFNDGDFSTLATFFFSAIVNAFFLLFAAWTMWKHPNLRRRAGVVLVLPFALYFLPWMIKGVFGGPMTGERGRNALILIGALIFAICLLFPKRVFDWLPKGLIQSRALNWLFIIGLTLACIFPLGVIAWLATSDSGQSSSGTALGYAIILLSFYIIVVGGAALLMMLWGWIGLRGGVENPSRKLHIAQLIMGTPTLLVGLATLSWLASQQ